MPKKIANNIGKAILGKENWPGPETTPAPFTLIHAPDGLGFEGIFTLQGIVVDADAPNGRAAITNAIVLESRTPEEAP